MKIAISAKGKIIDDLIDMRFGRCEYFQIHDTELKAIKILESKGESASGGAGIVAANKLIDENVDVIIAVNLGSNAFKIIDASDIKVYRCDTTFIKEALDKYNNNKLEEIKIAGVVHHGIHN